MRNCPHCGKEIQDEASYCRFCRRDVEPPLWLTSLQKCPYCAEWVERGIERCPLCGKVLVTEESVFTTDDPDSTELLLNEVRENIFAKDKPGFRFNEEEDLEDDEPVFESQETPAFHPIQRSQEEERPQPSDPHESQEGLGVLRERQRADIPLEPLEEFEPKKIKKEKPKRRINLPLGRILAWAFLLAASVAVVAVGIYAFREFDPLGALGLNSNPPATEANTPPPTETVIQDLTPTPTIGAAILPPEATSADTPGDCLLWSEITNEMVGEFVCAYGNIKRRFRVDSDIPYMAIFSEQEGTFAIVDRETFYNQFRPGDCIQATGEIELMRGSRPFIDAQDQLIACPSDSGDSN